MRNLPFYLTSGVLLSSVALLTACGGGAGTTAANDSSASTTTATTATAPTPVPAQTAMVAGRAYLRSDGTGMVVFNAGGTATAYTATGSNVLTWAVDGNTLTLASASGMQHYTLAEGGAAFADTAAQYVLPKPITLQQMVGQTLLESYDSAWRSWKFGTAQVELYSQQGSNGFSTTLELGTAAEMSNVLAVRGVSPQGGDMGGYLALLDGDMGKTSRWVYVQTANKRLDVLPLKNTTVTTPPASSNTSPVATPDTATTTAGKAVTVDVLSNDTDANGDTLSYCIYSREKWNCHPIRFSTHLHPSCGIHWGG